MELSAVKSKKEYLSRIDALRKLEDKKRRKEFKEIRKRLLNLNRYKPPKQEKENKAYITTHNILIDLHSAEIISSILRGIPYDGDGRKHIQQLSELSSFFEHVLNCCTMGGSGLKRARFKGDDKFTYSIPISSELGNKYFSTIFDTRNKAGTTRTLYILEELGLIKVIPSNSLKGRSREIALSLDFINTIFQDRKEYLTRKDRCIYIADLFKTAKNTIVTPEDLIRVGALRGLKKSKHELACNLIIDKVGMNKVYMNLKPIQLNIDILLKCATTVHQKIQVGMMLKTLSESGCEVVSESPLVVAYYPTYRMCLTGSRSFETGGFQNLSGDIKWAILYKGNNYDIKGSQINILKHEFRRIKIKDRVLEFLTDENLTKLLGFYDKGLNKIIRFGTIFNAGNVSIYDDPNSNKLYKILMQRFKYIRVIDILQTLKQQAKGLKRACDLLIKDYNENNVVSVGHRRFMVNDVGSLFNVAWNPETKKYRNKTVRKRQILAHMIQGIEAKVIYQFVLDNPQLDICSLEHDGLVCYGEITTEWKHEFLEFEMKHEESKYEDIMLELRNELLG